MRILLRADYGDYGCWKKGFERLVERHLGNFPDSERTNENFICLVEQYGLEKANTEGVLEIKEIPDNATDYEILEYEGYESLIYVVDGKIHWA